MSAETQPAAGVPFGPAPSVADCMGELVRAALLSPTSFNLQHVRFVVIESRQLRRRVIAELADPHAVGEQTALVALVGDVHAWQLARRYAAHLGDELQQRAEGKSNAVYRGRPSAQRDEALRSCGLALHTMIVKARERGWSCRALYCADSGRLAAALGLGDRFVPAALAAIDWGPREAHARAAEPHLYRNGFDAPWHSGVDALLERRRAIKLFDASYRIAGHELRELLTGSLLRPGLFGMHVARIVWIDDPALRRRIHPVACQQPQILDASGLAVLCGDVGAAPRALGVSAQACGTALRDHVMVSCAMTAQALMLAATARGHDSCPMIGFDFTAVGEMLGLPEGHLVAMMVALGRRAKDPPPRGSRLAPGEVVFVDAVPER